MRTHARHRRNKLTKTGPQEEPEPEEVFELLVSGGTGTDTAAGVGEEPGEVFRVRCPDCTRPIALGADDELLPQHAVCPTPWNPFGLTVCPGSGRAARDAAPADRPLAGDEQEWGTLLALPAGLNWRTQPFSHVGGPGSRPIPPGPGLRSRQARPSQASDSGPSGRDSGPS
jgi:hypothetical protein